MVALRRAECFAKTKNQVSCTGFIIPNASEFEDYLKTKVYDKVCDSQSSFAMDLNALATTDMEKGTLEKILNHESGRQPWEIGESLAESLLEETHSIKWPWNNERDKKTPRASLPGADLVGFIANGSDYYFAFGEVKTSNDKVSPPGVMTGRSGMIYQLETLIQSMAIQQQLMKWLHARCKGTEYWDPYRSAASNYLKSQGKLFVLFGVLLRDTSPSELDIKNRGISLSENVKQPTEAHLIVWYFPRPIAYWPQLCSRGV